MKLILKIAAVSAVFQVLASNAREPRHSGIGPEHLPATLLAPANDLPGDEALAALRATKLKVVPKAARDFTLADLSQFLGEGGTSVILPKGSVIHCPEALTARILDSPGGTLIPWPEFLIAHRNWVSTREVATAQIRGEAGFTDSDRAAFKAGGKLVIATFRGNPVTVLAPPAPAVPPTPAAPTP
ncbi:hypothetical protein [Luteolibacter sp. Populi]|uniref:hypothetical protein n=1 Tax=Luteolibacter sp. Populi TaxID=3230487 RepID=UPI003466BDD0